MKKKIFIFMQDFEGGGAEKMMLHLANEFYKNPDIELKIVVVRKAGSYMSLIHEDLPIEVLKANSVLGSIVEFSKLLRQEKPELIYCTLRHVNIAAIIAKVISRVKSKIIVREACHLIYPRGEKLSMKIAYFTLPLFYPLSDAVIAVSDGVSKSLRRKLWTKSKVHVLNNPVITESVIEKFNEEVNESIFNDNRKVIISIGRLNKQKDYGTLIKAFRIVKNKIADTRLCILGEGDERKGLQSLINTLGLENDVHLLGFKPNPYKYLKKSDLFVLSSRYEGSPNVLVEALASGIPVVSTDCPSGPFEILKGGEIAPLVAMGDVENLAVKIIDQIDNPTESDKRVSRSRDYLAKKVAVDYLNVI